MCIHEGLSGQGAGARLVKGLSVAAFTKNVKNRSVLEKWFFL